MTTQAIGEGVLRVKLATATLAVALALADSRKQTLDEYFAGLVRQDARALSKRAGDAVEWREAVDRDAAK